MDFSQIQELIRMLSKHKISEFILSEGDFKLVIRNQSTQESQALPAAMAAAPQAAPVAIPNTQPLTPSVQTSPMPAPMAAPAKSDMPAASAEGGGDSHGSPAPRCPTGPPEL